jgi:NADP-dependent 3-hydroxy acid dehydrogenase YdfG
VIFPVRNSDFCQIELCLLHKTIIITGASYGVGEALCHLLADIEYQLILDA